MTTKVVIHNASDYENVQILVVYESPKELLTKIYENHRPILVNWSKIILNPIATEANGLVWIGGLVENLSNLKKIDKEPILTFDPQDGFDSSILLLTEPSISNYYDYVLANKNKRDTEQDFWLKLYRERIS